MMTANDQFQRYYAEKLWETIPSVYRHEDGLADPPGVLRALVEVLAEQAAFLRRSQDRLWDDQFIELCDEWAVPYLGDLVGTRLLSDLNRRGRRVDVAKTIYYRRRKGTPRVLEELISDISGWDGKVVENFRRLARARHGLDPTVGPLAGRLTGTPPGGWADLRRPHGSELTDSPFDEFHHTLDVRRHRGATGRYNIPKLAVHLYRLRAFGVTSATPFALGDGQHFTFDPSGRDVPLFIRRSRGDDYSWDDDWRSALEWEIPSPIRCRLLAHAEYRLSEAAVRQLQLDPGLTATAAAELRSLHGHRLQDETRLRAVLGGLSTASELLNPPVFPILLRLTIVDNCGKQVLLPNALSIDAGGQPDPDHGSIAVDAQDFGGIIPAEATTAANLEGWPAPTIDKTLAIDPERGRFYLAGGVEQPVAVSYYYGFLGPLGAGTYYRRTVENSEPTVAPDLSGGGAITPTHLPVNGIAQIATSETFGPAADVANIKNLTLQAANRQRPYLRLNAPWVFDSGAESNARLVLDGLWIGALGGEIPEIVLRGNFECVVVRHCTFDPGGDVDALGDTLHPAAMVVEGFVEQLCIEHSITGPIALRAGGQIETASIADSIVQSVEPGGAAIALDSGLLELERVTVFGPVRAHRLYASESILTGLSAITDTQSGCFRFSAAPATSRLPRPYESFLFKTDEAHWFTSRRFGQPGYGQLSETAPEALQRGAENGSEMGAFASLLQPIRFDGLKTKIEEYMPFGLIPIFIYET